MLSTKVLYRKTLFIFRRDLRLDDNSGLIFALQASKEVVPCFIFTPQQIENNPYRGDRSLQFMVESLEELDQHLREYGSQLHYFYGNPKEVLGSCLESMKVDAVVVNRDYTPYSQERDHKISCMCKEKNISFHAIDDALLQPPEESTKADGSPYCVFTPFYRRAMKIPPEKPKANYHTNYCQDKLHGAQHSRLLKEILPHRHLQQAGGRKAALQLLRELKRCNDYAVERDFPALQATSHLSAHLKFMTCSIREAYWAMQEACAEPQPMQRSLYWRDFFTSIAYHYPHVFKGAFHPKFDQIEWGNNHEYFERWCNGVTGFPLVDAGMRELNSTGIMHNRVRMVAASFLIKDLHVDWRWGERYFAQRLIDYDPAINNGNWQWCASTGCDAQPYFRIFNPWNQQRKFDERCSYIKKWIPELSDVEDAAIHQRYLPKYQQSGIEYPLPMVDHSSESKIALAEYRRVSASTV